MYVLYLHLLTCTDTINPASEMTFLSFSFPKLLVITCKRLLEQEKLNIYN